MTARFFQLILNHPIKVILLTIIVAFGATSGAKNLVFKGDYSVFFSEDNPQLTTYETMQAIFNKTDTVAFIVSPKDGKVFTPETLTAIYELTEEAWQIPYSTRVDSITNFQYTWSEEDDMIVEDLVLDPSMLTEEDMPRLKAIALKEPQLVSRTISPEAHVSVVNVTIQLPGLDETKEVPEVAAKARAMMAQSLADHPDIEIRLSGLIMMNNAFSEASMSDFVTLVPLMLLVVIIGMTILLRTISGTVATIVVIIFSIFSTLGLAGWAGLYLTGPSFSAPTMILTLAVADCVHILATMFYEMRQGKDKETAIRHALRVNFTPIFLTSVTTAIGFLSLNFSDSPPFHDLGNMVAVGVMIAFVLSVTIFPALLRVLPIKVTPVSDEENNDLMHRVGNFVINKRNVLLPSMAVVIVALAVFTPQNELNDDFVKYFDTTVDFRQSTDYMAENMSGLTNMEISLETGEASGINNPEYLQTIGALTDWLREQEETDHVNSISDTIKRLNKNMHGDDENYYRLPEEQELSAQYLLLYELSLPYGLDLNNQVNVDKSSTRLVVTFRNLTSVEQLEMEQRVHAWLAENASQYEAQVSSPSLMFAHIGQRNITSMLIGTTAALLLISLLLGIALKSVRYGFISLIPNLAPAAMGFGLWFLIDGQVGLGLSVVAGMTLGIVVDDTVHFLSKYLYARRERGLDSEGAVRYAFGNVGRALWITTLVLVAGFMVLAQSSFKLNSDMGLLTALTILIALIVDFFFLPPLLMKLDGKTKAEKEREQLANV
ncbi:MAG: efflux RND transporter permease subunit [Pontibacterium sp.]